MSKGDIIKAYRAKEVCRGYDYFTDSFVGKSFKSWKGSVMDYMRECPYSISLMQDVPCL